MRCEVQVGIFGTLCMEGFEAAVGQIRSTP